MLLRLYTLKFPRKHFLRHTSLEFHHTEVASYEGMIIYLRLLKLWYFAGLHSKLYKGSETLLESVVPFYHI